jgi:predicted glycosyltransferase
MGTEIVRYIPKDFKKALLIPHLNNLIRKGKKIGLEDYMKFIVEFEIQCEHSLIDLFKKLNIKSSVKNDRYSLPFKEEIICIIEGASYLNHAFTISNITRDIVKELLHKDIYKLRFYLTVDAIIENDTEESHFFGRVVYKFRYVKH